MQVLKNNKNKQKRTFTSYPACVEYQLTDSEK